jgi:hypothetical protein
MMMLPVFQLLTLVDLQNAQKQKFILPGLWWLSVQWEMHLVGQSLRLWIVQDLRLQMMADAGKYENLVDWCMKGIYKTEGI